MESRSSNPSWCDQTSHLADTDLFVSVRVGERLGAVEVLALWYQLFHLVTLRARAKTKSQMG